MNLYIYTFHQFYPFFILPNSDIKLNYYNTEIKQLISVKWQLILTNEGSFTKALNALTGKKIKVKMSQKYNYKSKHINRNIRCVWLENSLYTKLTFARSLWLFIYSNDINIELIKNKPIGNSFIENKIDIYRNIHEIYYGYSEYLEKNFIINQGIWGRKYTLYYNYNSYITIQEFFSPYIMTLFN
uniref:Chorismate lyase n=1 Tax=Acrosorium ciliolatum TaxID=1550622 RepID=A0A1Z1M2D6_9FLOR|nr:hypothetical protein [Acrosorium ciliolatum]ARW59945.1 hypothetical protein [Acrosorium ciliolatum]